MLTGTSTGSAGSLAGGCAISQGRKRRARVRRECLGSQAVAGRMEFVKMSVGPPTCPSRPSTWPGSARARSAAGGRGPRLRATEPPATRDIVGQLIGTGPGSARCPAASHRQHRGRASPHGRHSEPTRAAPRPACMRTKEDDMTTTLTPPARSAGSPSRTGRCWSCTSARTTCSAATPQNPARMTLPAPAQEGRALAARAASAASRPRLLARPRR